MTPQSTLGRQHPVAQPRHVGFYPTTVEHATDDCPKRAAFIEQLLSKYKSKQKGAINPTQQ